MPRTTQHEMYSLTNGAWALVERFNAIDDASARERGETWHAMHKQPLLVIEEENDGGDLKARVIWRSPGTFADGAAPELNVDMASRIFMVAAGGVAIGAIGAVITAAVTSAARGSTSGFLVFAAFLAFAVGGALLLFRRAVPMELILWRNKPETARRKIIALLASGDDGEDANAQMAGVAPASALDPNSGPPTTGPAAAGAALLRQFIAEETDKLKQFADRTLAALAPAFAEL